jgi:hypothetical protein
MTGSLDLIRRLALALPETTESAHFGTPDFRVGGKIFATARLGEPVAMVKLPPHIQEAMLQAHPGVFIPAAGAWGRGGSTLVDTEKVDPDLLKELLALAWRQVAPKKLAATHLPD